MKTRKIYVVGGCTEYANWMEGKIVDEMEKADLVVFTGGEDVSPALYGKKAHPTTCCNPSRDKREVLEFTDAVAMNKKIIGICRGSQFLCAMAGGILVQHQGHPASHNISTIDGYEVLVTSSHHQRQYPWDMPDGFFKLIGWCSLSPYSQGEWSGDVMEDSPEVEIAFYPNIKALAIQSHPEWQDKKGPSIKYFRGLLNDLMDNKL